MLTEKIAAWRASKTLAYVVPFLAFMLLLPLTGSPILIENPLLPWYRHAPEQWVYPLQCVVCGFLLIFFRHHYTFAPFRGFLFATVLSLAGIAVWILPAALYDAWNMADRPSAGWLHYIGFQERDEGFDASFFREHSLLYFSAIAARLFRMVVIVAFVEEIFWRGFLMRYLIDRDKAFWKTPFGAFSAVSVVVTVVLFTLAHQPADYAAALIYGSLACWVAVRTKSLAACVWMHALANLVLGVYIMISKNWGLW